MNNNDHFSRIPSLSRGKLRDEIVVSLTEMILDGDLKPGDQLPSQQELTERLGVSRVALREAVQWLEAHGLVESIQGKGVVIKEPDPVFVLRGLRLLLRRHSTTLADLWQVRNFLEPEIAALAAQEATPEQLESMARQVLIMSDPNSDREEIVEADMRFHLLLAESTGNTVLSIFWQIVADLIYESIKRTNEVLPRYDHSKLFEAVKNRDPEAAREAARRHMNISYKYWKEWRQEVSGSG